MNNLVIDMSPLIYASYFALHEKMSWWMCYGVLNSILLLAREHQPDTLSLVYGSKKNKKNDLFPQYRQGRTTKIHFDEKQFQQLLAIFARMRIPQLRLDGVEADQILAACVNGLDECLIISDDKDFFQLLTDKKVMRRRKSGLWDGNRVCLEQGVKEANLFADIQALIGDNADNIPRILSARAAKEVVNTKGRLSTWLFDNPDYSNLKKLTVAKLQANMEQIKLNYQLVDLRDEVLKPEYYLPQEGYDLDYVKDKLYKMGMDGFATVRFNEFERIASLHGSI